MIRGADDAYRKAMGIMVDSSTENPRATAIAPGWRTYYIKFASLLRKQSIYVPAEWAVSESVRLFRELVDHDPRDPGRRIDLAHALNQMASLKGDTGRIDEAVVDSRCAGLATRAGDRIGRSATQSARTQEGTGFDL